MSETPDSDLRVSTNELMIWIRCVWLRWHRTHSCSVGGPPGTRLGNTDLKPGLGSVGSCQRLAVCRPVMEGSRPSFARGGGSPLMRTVETEMVPLTGRLGLHTYLAGETPWSRRRFTQGEARPLHSGRADPCEFPKCGNLDCIIYGSGGLRSRSPLKVLVEKSRWVFSPDLFLYRAFVLIQRAVQNEDFRPMLGMGCACVKKKKKSHLRSWKIGPWWVQISHRPHFSSRSDWLLPSCSCFHDCLVVLFHFLFIFFHLTAPPSGQSQHPFSPDHRLSPRIGVPIWVKWSHSSLEL